MNRTLTIAACLYLSLLASETMAASAEAMKEIKEYCNSMRVEGIDNAEANQMVEECIREQSEYLQDEPEQAYMQDEPEPSYVQEEPVQEEPEPVYVDCYAQAEEMVQSRLDKDPEAESNYDELVEKCLESQN